MLKPHNPVLFFSEFLSKMDAHLFGFRLNQGPSKIIPHNDFVLNIFINLPNSLR